MEIYGPGRSNRSQELYLRRLTAKLKAAGFTGGHGSDEVEISDVGRFLSYLSQLPQVRSDKVEALRQQIESGEYDEESKLDDIMDDLLADIGARPASR
jgi:anti-sigma28 factor (negative regulator of flagellin synthesis)